MFVSLFYKIFAALEKVEEHFDRKSVVQTYLTVFRISLAELKKFKKFARARKNENIENMIKLIKESKRIIWFCQQMEVRLDKLDFWKKLDLSQEKLDFCPEVAYKVVIFVLIRGPVLTDLL